MLEFQLHQSNERHAEPGLALSVQKGQHQHKTLTQQPYGRQLRHRNQYCRTPSQNPDLHSFPHTHSVKETPSRIQS